MSSTLAVMLRSPQRSSIFWVSLMPPRVSFNWPHLDRRPGLRHPSALPPVDRHPNLTQIDPKPELLPPMQMPNLLPLLARWRVDWTPMVGQFSMSINSEPMVCRIAYLWKSYDDCILTPSSAQFRHRPVTIRQIILLGIAEETCNIGN